MRDVLHELGVVGGVLGLHRQHVLLLLNNGRLCRLQVALQLQHYQSIQQSPSRAIVIKVCLTPTLNPT